MVLAVYNEILFLLYFKKLACEVLKLGNIDTFYINISKNFYYIKYVAFEVILIYVAKDWLPKIETVSKEPFSLM